jgi:D-sedoheptulose 7-phosphate isomerase
MNPIASAIESHQLAVESLKQQMSEVEACAQVLTAHLKAGSKILVCGNGGSAADAQHFAAELTGRFETQRRALPAIALTTDTSALTAIGNDFGFDEIFSRQVEALGNKGDCLVAISTSGNSKNVMQAVSVAKARGLRCIGLLGRDGGALKAMCDIAVVVNHPQTARIQECHLLIEHIWCALVDKEFTTE